MSVDSLQNVSKGHFERVYHSISKRLCSVCLLGQISGADPGFPETGFRMYKGVGVCFADFIYFI